jgi:uncharacterized protein
MNTPLDINDVDRGFYRERLEGFLPERIIDIHAHIWRNEQKSHVKQPAERVAGWPALVARDNPVEDLRETYRGLLPGRNVHPLVFTNALRADDLDGLNRYVAESSAAHGIPSLIWSCPDWSGEEFEGRLAAGSFLGAKPYLEFAPSHIPPEDIRIFDFMPHHQLQVLDRHGLILMMHVPRPARLRDPVNLVQLVEIEQAYPHIAMVVAHVGRAYCTGDIGDAFSLLSRTRRMLFDISANTNEEVFRRLIEAVGPQRILFGSDMPITRMRMRRICENGIYVNLVPRGRYGTLAGDRHMREVPDDEARTMTLFLYEEIDAFRRAALRSGLTAGDVEDVFYRNAAALLDHAGEKLHGHGRT